jgi:predicted GH43/DUF377 family glycosyl hydrolase
MKKRMVFLFCSILAFPVWIFTQSYDELLKAEFSYHTISGIGYQDGFRRQDPSNVIKADDLYYVWYTRLPTTREHPNDPYYSTIWYATSPDGWHWQEQGQALGMAQAGEWDDYGVITPYVAVKDGAYYMFYTATASPRPKRGFYARIGLAIADSPDGPWRRFEDNPILEPGYEKGRYDESVVDDAYVIVRDGKYWMYHKVRSPGQKVHTTKIALAIADKITGPYKKYGDSPVTDTGHTVMVWPHREGVAMLVDHGWKAGGIEPSTILYAKDGIHFEKVSTIERNGNLTYIGSSGYVPDAFTNTEQGQGISWGITCVRDQNPYWYLMRYNCNCQVP